MGINTSSVIYDELLVDVNMEMKCTIVEITDYIMCKLEERVDKELGFDIKPEAKVLEPTKQDIEIYKHQSPFVSDQYVSDEYIAHHKIADNLEIAEM